MFFNDDDIIIKPSSSSSSSSPYSTKTKNNNKKKNKFPRPLREGKSCHRPHELLLRDQLSASKKEVPPPASTLKFRNLSLRKGDQKKKRYHRRKRQPKLPSISRTRTEHPSRSVLASIKSIPVSFLRSQNQPHVMISSGCEILELTVKKNEKRQMFKAFQKWYKFNLDAERAKREKIRKRNEKWWGAQRIYTIFRDIYRYHIDRGFGQWYDIISTEIRKERNDAAKSIQDFTRRALSYRRGQRKGRRIRRLLLRHRTRESANCLRRAWLARAEYVRQLKFNSARTIQCKIRSRRSLRRFQEIRNRVSATKVQCAFRSMVSRRELRRRRDELFAYVIFIYIQFLCSSSFANLTQRTLKKHT
jgi:hypothetical protein